MKFYVIRGQRLLEQLNEETFNKLEQNVRNFVPPSKQRQHATTPVQIQTVELIPAPDSQTLEARATALSNGNKYQPIILFQGVIYEDEDAPTNITFTAVDENEYHIVPISLSQTNVKVRCTCMDFRWRFSIYNQKTDTLYGPGPELYQKKTNRPPNNPQGVPGLCKHLLRFANELQNSHVVSA